MPYLLLLEITEIYSEILNFVKLFYLVPIIINNILKSVISIT